MSFRQQTSTSDGEWADRLDQFWDGQVQGRAQPAIEPAADHADLVQRLHMDANAPAPATAFVRRLEASLMRSEAASRTLPTVALAPRTTRWRSRFGLPVRGVGRGASPHVGGQLATAAALVLLIMGGVLVYRVAVSGGGDDAATAVPFAAFSTPMGEELGPEDCAVEPRNKEQFGALLRDVRAEITEPNLNATPITRLPLREDGLPADEMVVAGVTRTAREMVACLNTRDLLRLYALWTDDGLRRTILGHGQSEQMVDGILRSLSRGPLTPVAPQERERFLGVGDVLELPNGQVRANVAVGAPDGTIWTMTMYFVERDGRYLIDSELISLEEPYPFATPELS